MIIINNPFTRLKFKIRTDIFFLKLRLTKGIKRSSLRSLIDIQNYQEENPRLNFDLRSEFNAQFKQ